MKGKHSVSMWAAPPTPAKAPISQDLTGIPFACARFRRHQDKEEKPKEEPPNKVPKVQVTD